MKKDQFGITLRFYAVVGFLLALLGQTTLCMLLLGFVIVVQKDEWLIKQAIQAFLLSLAPLLLRFMSTGLSLVDKVPLFGALFTWIATTLVATVNFVVLLLCVYAIFNAVREKDGGIFGFKNFADWAYGAAADDLSDDGKSQPREPSQTAEHLKGWVLDVGDATRKGVQTLSEKFEAKKAQLAAEKQVREAEKAKRLAAEKAAAEAAAKAKSEAEKAAAEAAAKKKAEAEKAAAEAAAKAKAEAEKAAAEAAAKAKSEAEKAAAEAAAKKKAEAEKAAAEAAAKKKAEAEKAAAEAAAPKNKKHAAEKQAATPPAAAKNSIPKPEKAVESVSTAKLPAKKTPPKKPAGKK